MKFSSKSILVAAFLFLFTSVSAQDDLQADGIIHTINYQGETHLELKIPSTLDPASGYNQITFVLKGADGGRRRISGICTEAGGEGAKVTATFQIGSSGNVLKPGGIVRFIVGEQGGSVRGSDIDGAGGGGGTGLLYKGPTVSGKGECNSRPQTSFSSLDRCWVILAVAGGGGGAYAPGGCAENQSGQGGNDGENGTDGKGSNGGKGGENGHFGEKGLDATKVWGAGFGGGGYIEDNATLRTGKGGGFSGGAGGDRSGSNSWTNGGFGYGGGGAGHRDIGGGGGGGGFSGGGGGATYHAGGGGGSFVSSGATSSEKKAGDKDKTPNNGWITYRFGFDTDLVNAPVALCQDVTISISGDDERLTVDDTDLGSYDPNDRPITVSICDDGGFCSPAARGFDCFDIGDTYAFSLEVDNGIKTSSCDFTVEIERGAPGVFTCPDPVTVRTDDCLGIVSDGGLYFNEDGAVYPDFEPQTYPACGTEIDLFIIRPDDTVDSDPIFADPADGLRSDTFDIGVSEVFYIARYEDDEALEQTQVCSFTVTVEPAGVTLNCPNDVTIDVPSSGYDPENPCSVTVEDRFGADYQADLDLNYNDCGEITYRIIGPGFDPTVTEGTGELAGFDFENGTSTVEYTLTRSPGEEYNCSFTVEVDQPDSPPEFTSCPRGQTIFINVFDSITEQQMLDQIDFQATDNCRVVQYELSGLDPSCEELGALQRDVRITAYDGSGLEDVCVVEVRTQPQSQLGVICREDLIVQADAGTCTASIIAEELAPVGLECGKAFTHRVEGDDNELISNGEGPIPALVLTVGKYEAVYSWTGRSGGLDVVYQCSFMIDVREPAIPTAACEDVTVYLSSPPADLAALVGAGSTVGCSYEDLVYELDLDMDLNCENTGVQNAILTVTDGSGANDHCASQITVIDDIAPVVTTCPSNGTIELNTTDCTITVPDLGAEIMGTTDCGTVIPVQFPAAGEIVADTYDGAVDISVWLKDDAGNISNPCTVTMTLQDSEGPAPQCNSLTVDLVNIPGDLAEQVGAGSTDNCGIASYSLDDQTIDCQDLGTHGVVLTVTDAAGNSGSCEANLTVVETSAPVANCHSSLTVELDVNGQGQFSIEELDNGSTDNCGIASLSFDESIPETVLNYTCANLGTNPVILFVTDVAGNVASCSATVTVVDNTAAVAGCRSVATVYLDDQGQGRLSLNEVQDDSYAACGGEVFPSFSDAFYQDQISYDCTQTGERTATLYVSDAEGNTSSCQTTVMVVDEVGPTPVCRDVTVQLDGSGNGSTTANAVDNGSGDACGIASTALSKTTFTCSDAGDNGVVLTVTDVNGNTGSCLATVTVEDKVDPVASCRDATVQLDAGGTGNLTANAVDNSSADACGIASRTLDRESFTCADIGENTVVLTVADNSGNASSCSATVVIVAPPAEAGAGWELASDLRLWPPDHSYQTFAVEDMIQGLFNVCGQSVSHDHIWIDRVSSDEAEDHPGAYDGSTLNDIIISPDCRSVQIRRERMSAGNGRVYVITLAAEDGAGGLSYAQFEASVPRWPWGWYSVAGNDGEQYVVNCASGNNTVMESLSAPDPFLSLPIGHFEAKKASLSIFPNPFHDQTTVVLTIPDAARITVEIFDLQGRRVRSLLSADLEAGRHRVQWDGTDAGGWASSTGLYFVRTRIGEEMLIGKVSLQKR